MATPTDAAPRRVVRSVSDEAEAATGGARRVDVAPEMAADSESMPETQGHQSTTSFTLAVILAIAGTLLLFVNSILGAAALALSVAALLWAAYGLGTEAWRAERAVRRRPHPDAPDGMPE